ncbi:hypothetical protein GOBAR_DD01290 [Gossypium barbadense]|nr:hypothetical protein GOBAR_DD01290 [Gossypium barbadense]
MSTEEEYYIKLYVKGKFVRGEMVRLKEDPYTISYFKLCKIVKKWLEFNIHEIDITIFYVDDLMLAVAIVVGAGDGKEGVEVISSKGGEGVKGLNREGGEGGEGLGGGVDFVSSKCGEGGKGAEVGGSQGGESGEGLGGKGVEVGGSQGSEGVEGLYGLDASVEGLEEGDGGLNGNVEENGEEWVEDESDSDLEDLNVYLVKVMYFSNGYGDEELQEASDDHGSILGSDDDDNTNACKRRSRFPTYNPNSTSPHFCIGCEQFKSAIRKYSRCCKRKLKIIKNKPDRVKIKCIASKNYSNMFRCMQVKIFHNEHNCCISFRNIMVNVKVITYHFEATIRNHPKMKKLCRGICYAVGYADELRLKNPRKFKSLDQSLLGVALVSDIVNNNLCEAFNFSIAESRFKNIITMLKEIKKETYLKVYAYVLQLINGPHEWRKSGIEPVLPLVEKTMLCKPKKNKRKAKNESKKVKHEQLSRAGLIMRCIKYGGEGHIRRSCLQPNTTGSEVCSHYALD